ncbi:hypothetical protein AWM79_01370 [Pseudomonas agarici]|uniref:YceK/YidQ family lipoprotein n=1 Tax=Pseudomonas agarici TaxID=46677 RepID=A0A0X1SW49_PSEAA|nr:YceK/YidQ family lipoprotein [Pseudomonas agarici]AMB84027.1 hypothetical protein AWM79_01370 [Pseudomonas agarici]
MSRKQGVSNGQRVRNVENLLKQKVDILKRLALIMLCGLAISSAGCGTLVERGESSKTYHRSGHYYVGVQYDWRLLTLEGAGGYDPIPTYCYLIIVCPFATLLSMPVDFLVDTVMLYSDHQNKLKEEQKNSGYIRDEHALAEDRPDEAALKNWALMQDFV